MNHDLIVYAVAGVVILCALLSLLLWPHKRADTQLESLRRGLTELDQGLRREIATATQAGLKTAFDQVLAGNAAMHNTLNAFRTHVSDTLDQAGGTTSAALSNFGREQATQLEGMNTLLREQRDTLSQRLQSGFDGFSRTLREEQERLRTLVAQKLEDMRSGNEQKLEAMRQAVDEKLQAAVESKVTQSFQRVTEQLAQLHQDIGQVQSVAGQVGDLKRLFSNVSARGGWGEAHLGAALADVLPETAYAQNVRFREDRREVVEFALRVPIKNAGPTWLAINSKFPIEDYDRLLQAAQDRDRAAEAEARKALERRIRLEAARIAEKYICAPETVEFAVMYLPSEGLFAEVVRSPGLVEAIRRERKVAILGPSLLAAFLHTFRIGHVMLALEANAGEIEKTLRAVKTEWTELGQCIDAMARNAKTLANTIDKTRVRTRTIGQKLDAMEALAPDHAKALLGVDEAKLATLPFDDEVVASP